MSTRPRSPTGPSEAEFRKRLDLFPQESQFNRTYVRKAGIRGWKIFWHLPPGTGTECLLDVGSISGLYSPAYIDLRATGRRA